jgi:hypothetical protein
MWHRLLQNAVFCHCEEQSDEAISLYVNELEIASLSLAMTNHAILSYFAEVYICGSKGRKLTGR